MPCPLPARYTRSSGRSRHGRQTTSEFAIIAVLVAVAGVGAAGLLSNAFGSSRGPTAEHPADRPQHEVNRRITERPKAQSVASKDAAGRR